MLQTFKSLFSGEIKQALISFGFLNENSTYKPAEINLDTYFRDGYKNIIAFRCINEIGKAAKTIELTIKKKNGDDYEYLDENNPLSVLIKRPNPLQSTGQFIEELIHSRLFAGNAFLFKSSTPNEKKVPLEMYNLPVFNVSVKAGAKMLPSGYEINPRGDKKFYPLDDISGDCQILHLKSPNPKNSNTGISPLEAAAYFIDQHNYGAAWNNSLLQNGAKPSWGIFSKGMIDKEAEARFKTFFNRDISGAKNAGKPLVVSGEMDVKQLGLSPLDMDHGNGMKQAAIYIAMAYGVPIPLIIPDASTYNNMTEARQMLYEDTVLPLLDEICGDLTRWLQNNTGEEILIGYDPDTIPALAYKRASKIDSTVKLKTNSIITIDEAREELGYEPKGGMADEILVTGNMVPINDAGISDASNPDDPANFDDNSKSMEGSKYPEFDYDFAFMVKTKHPDIWNAAPNPKAEEAFKQWGEVRSNTMEIKAAHTFLTEREEWAERNTDGFRLPTVINQMKWGIIGAKGEAFMKELVLYKAKKNASAEV